METRTLMLDTHDGHMALFEAVPDATARGAIVVIQEAFGVNHHIQDVVARCAAAGYHAVAPHLFHRTGSPAYGYEDFSVVIPHVLALTDVDLLSDVGAALVHLRAAGWADRQIGVVGFCLGGRVTFLVAGHEALGAAVGFYGGGVVTGRTESMPALLDLVPGMRTPWLGLFGDADGSIPIDDVEHLRHELNSAAVVDTAIVRYPDAAHGFHCDVRDSYDEAAATDGWRRTLEWLDDHLAPRSSTGATADAPTGVPGRIR
jgi:carboxymethylenebutenolidase